MTGNAPVVATEAEPAWCAARDRATWENQAWAAGVEWARIWRLAVDRGATYETYDGACGGEKAVHMFANALTPEAPGD